MTDLAFLDATAQAELVRTGEVSPVELVDGAITRIEKLNPQLNAVIHERFERARSDAAGPLPDGPFRGVPILFKDLMCQVEGDPYHEGMRFLKNAGHRADHTDNLAQRYFDAGFVYLGRTNTPELGLVPTAEPDAYGATHNPWKSGITSGGSSGGSAAAVAGGMVPVAHANDGGGSIRIPASCCGLVGLKPTRGRSSLGPELNEISSFLIAEGCVSRSVRDTAAVLDAISGPFPGDPTQAPRPDRPYRDEVGADPGRLRIGLLTHNPIGSSEIDPECVTAAKSTAELLESLGHQVEDSYPGGFDNEDLVAEFGAVWAVECAYALDEWGRKVGRAVTADDVELLTWGLAEAGRSVTAPQLLAALASSQQASREAARWWADGFDLLLTPTLGEPPVEHGAFASTPENPIGGFIRSAAFVPFTAQFNISGQPAISLPLHWTPEGLPVGIQLVAGFGREDVLIRVAAQLETARPWADRIPPTHA
ncbi:MAG TPA: amidase family protein [Acidimicrobiia bacterium]|nr:amidase family protein [Acidimicrobiia bacterium]